MSDSGKHPGWTTTKYPGWVTTDSLVGRIDPLVPNTDVWSPFSVVEPVKQAEPPRFPRVRALLYDRPWAMLPGAFDAMVEILEFRIEHGQRSRDDIEASLEAARRLPRSPQSAGSVAVLQLHGVISHRAGMMADISGGTSTREFAELFRSAMADKDIASIVLDVDSPGGSVDGVEELADEIDAARGSKPIVAVANTMAASAAYWIASQADELVVTPSGEVGSIGVIAAHTDMSEAAKAKGIKRTFIHAGKYKAEGNSFEPLAEGTRSYVQSQVDAFYEKFVRAVARGRRKPLAMVRGEEFGEGRVLLADSALAVGMVDRIATLDETVARLQGRAEKKTRARAARAAALRDLAESDVG